MNTANELTLLLDELAGYWTEPVLAILKSAGIRKVSVDLELETWRTLKEVLRCEMRWQRAFRFSTRVSLGALMEQVLFKTSLRVAQKLEPEALAYEFESRVRRWAGARRPAAAERILYAEIVGQATVAAAFKPPSRSDFTPRLRVSALRG